MTMQGKIGGRGRGATTLLAAWAALTVLVGACAPDGTATPAAETPSTQRQAEPAVVDTTGGPVRGAATAGVNSFMGIPYAAPPVGQLRWRPPQPPQPWVEPRDATAPGPACPQEGFEYGQPSTTEDCLYLNVTTPGDTGGADLPVMVWLHGGSFADGAGHLYEATRLAETGKVMVVTINYRLRAFGFLAHPGLDGSSAGELSGNYGLQDQQAALRWVRDNAAAFGGDPGNVTLFGESAGATSVCVNLTAPGSAGLFHRAIMQSNPCLNDWSEANPSVPRPRDVAEERGRELAQGVDCAGTTTAVAECLRGTGVTEIRQASEGPSEGTGFSPVYGGQILPMRPQRALASGEFNQVPVLHGINRDEERFMLLGSHQKPLAPADYQRELERMYGTNAEKVLAAYPCQDDTDCRVALAAARTDANFAHALLDTSELLARHTPTYVYEFADRNAPGVQGIPDVGYPLGAYHTAELPYLFEVSWAGELAPDQQQLSNRMIGYWSRFARTGDPNTGSPGRWALFNENDQTVRVLAPNNGETTSTDFAIRHHNELWESIG